MIWWVIYHWLTLRRSYMMDKTHTMVHFLYLTAWNVACYRAIFCQNLCLSWSLSALIFSVSHFLVSHIYDSRLVYLLLDPRLFENSHTLDNLLFPIDYSLYLSVALAEVGNSRYNATRYDFQKSFPRLLWETDATTWVV